MFNPTDLTYEEFTLSKNIIQELFQFKYANLELFNRIDWIAEYVKDRIEIDYNINISKKSITKIRELLLNMCKHNNLIEIYGDFLKWVEDTHNIEVGCSSFNRKKLYFEDVFPLILLKFYLYGVSDFKYIKHLLIDEMQDYTPIQYEIINKLFRCPKTIIGDIYQVVNPYMNILKIEYLNDVMDEKTNVIRLQKSYRSTYEITKFSQIFSHNNEIIPIERHGDVQI